jgi:hypothetical protein
LTAAEFFESRWPCLGPDERHDWLERHVPQFARQMYRLHAAGFDHRDLKFANILVSSDPADPRIWLLDLEGVRVWRRLPVRRAVKNLARISVSALVCQHLSRTDRLRFLRVYLAGQSARAWKTWWRRIAGLADRKIAANRRGGRLIS